jgi:hypothetical protein
MPIGTTAAIMLGIGAAGAGVAATKMMSPKMNMSQPLPLPQPPSQEVAQDKAAAIGKVKRASATQSIYTSPLGIGGTAEIAKKTLLGQ